MRNLGELSFEKGMLHVLSDLETDTAWLCGQFEANGETAIIDFNAVLL